MKRSRRITSLRCDQPAIKISRQKVATSPHSETSYLANHPLPVWNRMAPDREVIIRQKGEQ
jgi:hypothetical protein